MVPFLGRIFVVVPVIAQRKVDDANYEIQGVNILDPKPRSVLIQINSTIQTDGQVKAEVDSFEANLALANVPNAQPFMTLTFPKTNADKFQIVNISQIVEITDQNALQQFNHALFQNHTLRISMYGKTSVKPAGMSKKYPVNVRKTIEFNGLNRLNGTKLQNTSLSLDRDAPNFNATAIIVNPSYYTLDMGNVTLQSFADGQPVGNVAIANLLLRPGKNMFPIETRINQTRIAQIVERPAYCTTGNVPFKLQGKRIQSHGEDITWLASSLSNANMTVDVSIAAMMGSLESANFCV
ncbi:hypothetical protein MANI_010345 [Metarhizium anisopliae]